MPHIILEYSDNMGPDIQQTGLLQQLHTHVSECGLFAPEAVKARSIAYQDAILSQGKKSFVHVTVSILSGRSQQQREQLSDELFALCQKELPTVSALSVNIHEMNKDTYRK